MTIQRGRVGLALTGLLASFACSPTPSANISPNTHADSPFPTPAAWPQNRPDSVHSRPLLEARDSSWIRVRATVYYPSGQRMYSGEAIPRRYTLRHRTYRYLAVSHDLLARYGLQDTVLVRGDQSDPYWDASLNGTYIIKDLMNRRYKRRIDILSRPGHERDIGLWRARILSLSELRSDT